jgi:hypothetical protein
MNFWRRQADHIIERDGEICRLRYGREWILLKLVGVDDSKQMTYI